ncbi:hypothetical protein VVMO6_04176 [Vibrio vulnificus MO6-24/O]|nr:hypothetical protein VVMO6_04176 [Vibrio vulnificus MO6-24/O]
MEKVQSLDLSPFYVLFALFLRARSLFIQSVLPKRKVKKGRKAL